MIALGISGLPNAQEHLRRTARSHSPLDARICQGLDSAACLVENGRVVAAAAEERFTGEKGTGRLPVNAIDYCLASAGCAREEVDVIAHGFDYDRHRRMFARARSYFDNVLSGVTMRDALAASGWTNVERRFSAVEHHLAHAQSAFLPSGYDSAVCIVSDGMAEIASMSVFHAHDGEQHQLMSQPIDCSLGLLYSICTRFLGFTFNSDEYKVMGLAAYGDPTDHCELFRELLAFDPVTGGVVTSWPRGTLLDADAGYPAALSFLSQRTGLAPREDDELTDEHARVAAALQERLTEVLVQVTEYWLAQTDERCLCLAGGTFLNCRANQALCALPSVEHAFAQPASGDDGTALGAALHVASRNGGWPVPKRSFSPYLGAAYSPEEVAQALEPYVEDERCSWEYIGIDDSWFAAAAEDLAQDKIIGWFHGRMEFGPRALGNRSILALPSGHDVKNRINSMVKFREPFRPFAPAVLDEDCDDLFSDSMLDLGPYMLCTARVRAERRDDVPAIVHADGTARVQTVSRHRNETFWRLLSQLKRRTGLGCVVNTSLNVKGQPLIMSPAVAIDTFLRTSLNRLYMEGFQICKT